MAARYSRRDALRFGVAGAATLSLGGLASSCSLASDNVVKFYNWQDYVDPALLSDFEALSGLTVSYSTYASNDELGDRLALAGVPRRGNRKATSFDLIVPSDSLFRRLRAQERLQPLDSSIVTEELLANLDEVYRTLEVDPGNRFAIPWATGSTGIGYDTTVFPEPPGWDVFLDSANAGKMTLLDEKREAFAAALYSLGLDPNTVDPADIGAAEAELVAMAANAAFDSAGYLDGLASGTLVAAQAFSSDVLQAQARNPNLAFTIPEAGGTRWIDLLCIPENAPNAEGANRLIAFYLDGKVAAQNAVAVRVDSGNTTAEEFLSDDILADPAIYPPADVAARLQFLVDLGDDEETYNAAWTRVRG